ncbi:MAG TPA: RNA polymerase sigma factor [Ktedonosporobacter sp.]|jgi:RNA polymerase sigma-70 factor (ECF subfamily)|nr:RNA polymerase sigma factor [Ktedonosporobacter sp.]
MGGPLSDDAALADLYQRHVYTLLSFIRRYVSTREDAEDVLLEVFLAAMERNALIGLSEGEQLAWLRRVAHNKCVDTYRRSVRRPAIPLDSALDMLYGPEEQTPEQVALRSEEYALLRDYLMHLPEQQQAVLRLRFADDLRSSEIARRLNKSEGSVRMLLSRALNHLRKVYAQEIPERRSSL